MPLEVGASAFGWALWKLLDQLTVRLLRPAGDGLAPAAEIDQPALLAAVGELSDTQSRVVQALARLLGREYPSEQERELALERAMAGLSREQGLVVAAVVLYATQSGKF